MTSPLWKHWDIFEEQTLTNQEDGLIQTEETARNKRRWEVPPIGELRKAFVRNDEGLIGAL